MGHDCDSDDDSKWTPVYSNSSCSTSSSSVFRRSPPTVNGNGPAAGAANSHWRPGHAAWSESEDSVVAGNRDAIETTTTTTTADAATAILQEMVELEARKKILRAKLAEIAREQKSSSPHTKTSVAAVLESSRRNPSQPPAPQQQPPAPQQQPPQVKQEAARKAMPPRFDEPRQMAPAVARRHASESSRASQRAPHADSQRPTAALRSGSSAARSYPVKRVGVRVRVTEENDIFEGTISEMDDDYLTLIHIQQTNRATGVSKSYSYPLQFVNDNSVELIGAEQSALVGSAASPSWMAHLPSRMKKSLSQESSIVSQPIEHLSPYSNSSGPHWQEREPEPELGVRSRARRSTRYSSSSEVIRDSISEQGKYQLTVGKRVMIRTGLLHLKGKLKSYENGMLSLENAYDILQGKKIRGETVLEDREILECRQFEPERREEESTDANRRRTPRDFELFRRTWGRTPEEIERAKQNKSYSRPAGYSSANFPQREVRKRPAYVNKPYADDVSFR